VTAAQPRTPPAQLAELTEREREILQLVAAGLSNADIARRLVISPLTAKTHVARILAKLDCHDRAQLVALALRNRLRHAGRTRCREDCKRQRLARYPVGRHDNDRRGLSEPRAGGGFSWFR
jgi:DNA-binding CsgD family transcriptional regulator